MSTSNSAISVPTPGDSCMPVLVLDASACQELLAKRREMGGDRYDEVWEGIYIMSPLASVEHQRLVAQLTIVVSQVIGDGGLVLPGANVTDRLDHWENNFRCPDVVVVLDGGAAKSIGAALVGGPDFLVEVRSQRDRTHEKLPFYAKLGVRELLIIDCDSKELELYRLVRNELQPQGLSSSATPRAIDSAVLPLSFSHATQSGKSRISVRRTDATQESWLI